jgi:hypothetical protein
MTKATITVKFEVIIDSVLDGTSERNAQAKDTICYALQLLVNVAKDHQDSQTDVMIAKKLLDDVYANEETT